MSNSSEFFTTIETVVPLAQKINENEVFNELPSTVRANEPRPWLTTVAASRSCSEKDLKNYSQSVNVCVWVPISRAVENRECVYGVG